MQAFNLDLCGPLLSDQVGKKRRREGYILAFLLLQSSRLVHLLPPFSFPFLSLIFIVMNGCPRGKEEKKGKGHLESLLAAKEEEEVRTWALPTEEMCT